MNKKLIIILVAVLAVGGIGAKMFLLPKKAVAKMKITGTLYVLPQQFTLNLADGKYATLTLTLDLAPGQSDGASATSAGATPSDGIGTLPEEPVIRAIVTNDLTNASSRDLLTVAGRNRERKILLTDIKKQTDVKVTTLYFTNLAVQ